MEFSRVWLPYLYLYGVGGLLFSAGMILVVRSGVWKARRIDRRWLAVLVFGFLWYAGLHGLGILAALYL